MQSQKRWRVVVCIAPPLAVVGVAALLACNDVKGSTAVSDDWAEQTIATMNVRRSVTLFRHGRPNGTESFTHQGSAAVIPAPRTLSALSSESSTGGPQTHLRHIRDKSGKVHSIGFYYDRPDAPPKFIFQFEEGRIQAVVSAKYKRHGRGFVRTESKLTLFDSAGAPQIQVGESPDSSSLLATSTRWTFSAKVAKALRDVSQLFLPKNAYAEEVAVVDPDGACWSEYASVLTAITALAAAAAALQVAGAACIDTLVLCPLAAGAIAAFNSALTSYSAALDRLMACRGEPSVGGNGGGVGPSGTLPEDVRRLSAVVQEFIRNAIAAGRSGCTPDATYCVYYSN